MLVLKGLLTGKFVSFACYTIAQDLPTLWDCETTSNVERKQLLRFLIKDVTVIRQDKVIDINLRWQTGASTKLQVDRVKKSWEITKTAPEAITIIKQTLSRIKKIYCKLMKT